MSVSRRTSFQPVLEDFESRCLLSVAVVEVLNTSSYNITFDLRWTANSAWTARTESPGQGNLFWTNYSSSLTPQVLYNTSAASGSQTTATLGQGYGIYNGSGAPPVSSAKLYQFQNTSTGVQLVYGNPPPPGPISPPVPGPSPAPNAATSTNWSGYVAESSFSQPKAGSVTNVSGTWKVPTVTGPPSGSTYSSVWVGIDGANGSTVEQIGTEEDVINGRPIYRAWWEMYSTVTGQPEQVISGMIVSPGDSINASVQYLTTGSHAGQFELAIVDATRGNVTFVTYQTTAQSQNPQAQRSSAEWIVEAPTVGNGQSAIANFGSVNFTNASAMINGVTGSISSSSWQSEAVNLVTNGVTRATTSVLSNAGRSFTVTYNASTANLPQSGIAVGITSKATRAHRRQVVPTTSTKMAFDTRPLIDYGKSAMFGASIHKVSHSKA